MSDQEGGMASDDVEVLRVRCAALGDSPAEKLVRRLLWDLSPPGKEPTDEAWAKVSTRDVKVLAAAVASLGSLRASPEQAPVTADDIARSQIYARTDDAEPVRSVNVREADFADAIQAWACDRYGSHNGPWEANLIIGGVHRLTVHWEWEDAPEDDDEPVGDEGEGEDGDYEAEARLDSLLDAEEDAKEALLAAVMAEDAEWNAKDGEDESASAGHRLQLGNARKSAVLALQDAQRALADGGKRLTKTEQDSR